MRSFSMMLSIALISAATGVASAQTHKGQPCPPGKVGKGMMGEKGAAGYEPGSKQPQERSAILPAAPQNEQSAAPTVQQDGRAVLGETTCERAPNKARKGG